jgi:hypothetical protein
VGCVPREPAPLERRSLGRRGVLVVEGAGELVRLLRGQLYDYDTRLFNTPGGAFFSILQPGYYAVYYDLYWFPNDAVGSGSTAALAPNHHDLRVGGALLYCRY